MYVLTSGREVLAVLALAALAVDYQVAADGVQATVVPTLGVTPPGVARGAAYGDPGGAGPHWTGVVGHRRQPKNTPTRTRIKMMMSRT